MIKKFNELFCLETKSDIIIFLSKTLTQYEDMKIRIKNFFEKYPYNSTLSNEEIDNTLKLFDDNAESELFNLKNIDTSIKIFVQILEDLIKFNKRIYVGLEHNYIDTIYRDSYYNHFSEKHLETLRYCKRVVFFNGNNIDIELLIKSSYTNEKKLEELEKNCIGSSVIKPLKTGAIGRTLINPKYLFPKEEKLYLRTSKYTINYIGLPLKIQAFPFSMQDHITTTCAETTIIEILDYYSNQYNNYRFATPTMIREITERESFKRVVPTIGLSYEMISKILCEFGFSSNFYGQNLDDKKDEKKKILSYYIESGMPVAIGIDKLSYESSAHSIICIGHGKTNIDTMMKNVKNINASDEENNISDEENPPIYCANTIYSYNEYIVMDDLKKPYSTYTYESESDEFESKGQLPFFYNKNENENNENENNDNPDKKDAKYRLKYLAIPLHKRMYMDAKMAELVITSILKNSGDCSLSPYYYYELKKTQKIGTENNPVIIRLFLASSRHYKQFRLKHSPNSILTELYKNIPLPHFIWVCELYDKDGYKYLNAFGEIIIDATFTDKNLLDSVLMINYPNYHMALDNYHNSIIQLKNTHQDSNNQMIFLNYKDFSIKAYQNNLSLCNCL